MCTLGLGGDALTFGEFGAGRLELAARLGQLAEQPALLFGDLVGLGFQGVGIRTRRRLGLGVEMLCALARDAHRRADAFGESGQREPPLLRRVRAFAEADHRRLVRGQLGGLGLEPRGDLVVFAPQRGLGLVGVVELGAAGDEVIGG